MIRKHDGIDYMLYVVDGQIRKEDTYGYGLDHSTKEGH